MLCDSRGDGDGEVGDICTVADLSGGGGGWYSLSGST